MLACGLWAIWHIFGPPLLTRRLLDAVNEGRMTDVCRLLRWGANPNQSKGIVFWDDANSEGPSNALNAAAYYGRTDMVRIFLDNDAAINQRDEHGRTPFVWAVLHGPSDTIPLLLARGADVHAPVASGNNLIYIATASKIGRQLELFMNCGIDVNARSQSGATAIEYAIGSNSVEEARILLEHGADWKHCSRKENCAWLNAAKNGETTILKLLLEHGADVNARIHGTTALAAAATNNQVDATRLLLAHGAKPNAATEDGHSLLSDVYFSTVGASSPSTTRWILPVGAIQDRQAQRFRLDKRMKAIETMLRKAGAQ